jgi:hypothetical protein
MRTHLLLPFAFLTLAACSGQPPEPWERADHTPPTVTETSFCRDDARRQANTLYPGQAPNDARGLPRTTDDRNFPAEIRYYEQCMTRSGFVRASAAPAR